MSPTAPSMWKIATDQAKFSITPMRSSVDSWTHLLSCADATIFHSFRWQEVLRKACGIEFQVAIVRNGEQPLAGVLLASQRNLFGQRLTALPFSDSCPPLCLHAGANEALLHFLAVHVGEKQRIEVRGVSAPPPWISSECFSLWTLDLSRSFVAIEENMDRNFRRQIRRAQEADLKIEHGYSEAQARRFFALYLETRRRIGVPSHGWRFIRALRQVFNEDVHIWLVSKNGLDEAAALLLKDGQRLIWKWSARRDQSSVGAGHLLASSILRHYSGSSTTLDLGRTDVRNHGLCRFKQEMGAMQSPLPIAYYPSMPKVLSAEHLPGVARIASHVWRHLPIPIIRLVGGRLHGYLS